MCIIIIQVSAYILPASGEAHLIWIANTAYRKTEEAEGIGGRHIKRYE